MPNQPAWRRTFDSVERKVGRPLEDVVTSSTYVDALVLGVKLQVTVARAVRGTVERQIGAILHLAAMPTRGDVRRLSRQLTTLTGEVRTLAVAIEEVRRASEPDEVVGPTAGNGAAHRLREGERDT